MENNYMAPGYCKECDGQEFFQIQEAPHVYECTTCGHPNDGIEQLPERYTREIISDMFTRKIAEGKRFYTGFPKQETIQAKTLDELFDTVADFMNNYHPAGYGSDFSAPAKTPDQYWSCIVGRHISCD